jgi:uncharacterized protein (DUF1684 family)
VTATTTTGSATASSSGAFAEEWEQWHTEHEGIIGARHGFLSITNIHWLSPERQRFEDAPGSWSTGPDGISVELGEGEHLVVDGETRIGVFSFGVLAERASCMAYWDDEALEVAKRCGYDLVRPRHPGNPLREAYRGTPAFPPDPMWELTGRFSPFDLPQPTTVGAAVEGLEHVYHAVGRVDFSVGGEEFGLIAFPGHKEGTLLLLFTDATSGVTTYGANRSVVVGPVAEDATVTVDFNRSVNLPCAYTDLATCPLPPAGNHLPVAVEAGELMPWERRPGALVSQVAPPPLPAAP